MWTRLVRHTDFEAEVILSDVAAAVVVAALGIIIVTADTDGDL